MSTLNKYVRIEHLGWTNLRQYKKRLVMKTLQKWIGVFGLSLCFNSYADQQPYSDVLFDKLTKSGKSVVVEVHADWCPTCRAQSPIVKELLNEKELVNLTALKVDFDNQKAALKKFNVRQQSTLIGFKGEKEVARSVGDTNKANIKKLLLKTL